MTRHSDRLAELANALIPLLDDENDALSRMDIATVSALFAEKRRLLARLETLCDDAARAGVTGRQDGASSPAVGRPSPAGPGASLVCSTGSRDVTERLMATIEKNRSLLSVAIAAQRSLMTIIATAARQAEQPGSYAGNGSLSQARLTPATAIIASA